MCRTTIERLLVLHSYRTLLLHIWLILSYGLWALKHDCKRAKYCNHLFSVPISVIFIAERCSECLKQLSTSKQITSPFNYSRLLLLRSSIRKIYSHSFLKNQFQFPIQSVFECSINWDISHDLNKLQLTLLIKLSTAFNSAVNCAKGAL